MQIMLAQPRGFCAGVERAIDIVEATLQKHGPPIYVRHEIVHNQRVVENLRQKGVIFVDEIDKIPVGEVAVFSAHGVAKKIVKNATTRNLKQFDATCPLVSKVHGEGRRHASKGREIILIGHGNHPEVEGTLGQIDGRVHLISEVEDVAQLEVSNPDKLAFITQTTLSVDDTRNIIQALRARFPKIVGPDVKDICYATQNRQAATRLLASQVDIILVVGAINSSNSNRLCEVGADTGTPSILVQDPSQFNPASLRDFKKVGITAGASTPEELVRELIERIKEVTDVEVTTMEGIAENVRFSVPISLRDSLPTTQTQQ